MVQDCLINLRLERVGVIRLDVQGSQQCGSTWQIAFSLCDDGFLNDGIDVIG